MISTNDLASPYADRFSIRCDSCDCVIEGAWMRDKEFVLCLECFREEKKKEEPK